MSTISVFEIEESDRDYWDEKVSKFEIVHPLNAFGWGKVRAVDGWSPSYFMARKGDEITGAVMVLTRSIPLSGLSIMYAPRGPVFNPADRETLKALLKKLRMEARKKRAIFLRIDPNIAEDVILKEGDPFVKEGFVHLDQRWTYWNTPGDVSRIELNRFQTEDELFMSLDRQARKAVRKSRKQGLTIRHATSLHELEIFYGLFKNHTIQKGFMCRGYDYQKSLWDEFISRGKGVLFLALLDNKIVGGLICLIFGERCLAMHMGTPYEYQHLRPNDAYVWEAIRWAKKQNCLWFSFRGVGSTPTQEFFKNKFSPRVIFLTGYYDLPFYPLLYRLIFRGEFDILPRTWRSLMWCRRQFKMLTGIFD